MLPWSEPGAWCKAKTASWSMPDDGARLKCCYGQVQVAHRELGRAASCVEEFILSFYFHNLCTLSSFLITYLSIFINKALNLGDYISTTKHTESRLHNASVFFIPIKTGVPRWQQLCVYVFFKVSNKPVSDLTNDKKLHRETQVNVTEVRAEAQCDWWEHPVVLPSHPLARAVCASPSWGEHTGPTVSPRCIWHTQLTEDCSERLGFLIRNAFIFCQQLLSRFCFLQLYS